MLLRGRTLPLASTFLPTVFIPMLAVPPPLVPIVIFVVFRRSMAIVPVPMVPRRPMAVIVIIPSVILPSTAVIVSFPISFAVAVPVSFPVLVTVVAAPVTISIPFAVTSVFAVFVFDLALVFFFLVFRGFLASAAGGGPAVLGSFLLPKPYLLAFNKLGKGSPTSLVIFERLVFVQVFKEWYRLLVG